MILAAPCVISAVFGRNVIPSEELSFRILFILFLSGTLDYIVDTYIVAY